MSAPARLHAGFLPDLRTVVPAHLQILNEQQRDSLRSSNGIANTGVRPGHPAGWVDRYHHSLEGQKLDLTTAPNGVDLYLVSTSNFAERFRESDDTNNTEWVRFRLSRDSSGNRKVTVTGHSPCETDAMCRIGVPNR